MSTVSERLAALRSAMRSAGVAAYLIPTGDPHSSEYLPAHYNSREYFSGFTGENSTLVVTLTKSALWPTAGSSSRLKSSWPAPRSS